MNLLTTFKGYINDEKAAEMFISGQAGTGKTTSLNSLVQYCIDNNINYTVCAYTHKACGILASKLPEKAVISTLHKFLKKRPTVNEHALDVKHIQNSKQQGTPEEATILFLDEYSMLGEKDYSDIGDRQWLDGTDIPNMKAIYIGDPNQLPPINDQPAIYPSGKYNIKLTKIYRQAGDSELLFPLTQLVKMIEGATPEPLVGGNDFIRGMDIVQLYKHGKVSQDKIMLAYTNKRVEDLNRAIAGKGSPERMDQVFSPTTKHHYTFVKRYLPTDIDYIDLPFGDDILEFNTKYRTLEHLLSMVETTQGLRFALLDGDNDEDYLVAYVFGHYVYKCVLEDLGATAVVTNKAITDKHNIPAKYWAGANKKSVLAKKRAKAWRDYFTFKNCVICLDFPYAMTVHKSQGSTFDTVFLDTEDLGQCAARDYQAYLKLMYVAISRASNKVYTN